MGELNFQIGPLMKAARKFKKFNQADVAEAIGCSQSALSKMEHNLLIPSAPQWFLFSRFTAIPPEAIETGVIDRHTKVSLDNKIISPGYKLPKRYRIHRAQKVRELYPFIQYLEKKFPGHILDEFIQGLGVEPEFFLDFDNVVNFQMIVDFVNKLISLKASGIEEIKELVTLGQNSIYWDQYGESFKNIKNLKELMVAYSLQQAYFQADFHLKVETKGTDLWVVYYPGPHLYQFLKDFSDETSHWIGHYRKSTIEHLVNMTLHEEVEAQLISELSTSPLETHFKIY